MDLFSDDDLAVALRVSSVDEGAATQARARATDYLRLELGVEFGEETRTLTERVRRHRTFLPLPGPIASITSVDVDEQPLTVTTHYEQTDMGVWCPDTFGQLLSTDGDWCTVEVIYEGGFATLPDELGTWGLHLGLMAYAGPRPGTRSVTVGGYSETYTDGAAERFGLPGHVLRSLRNRYGSGRRSFGSVLIR